MFYDFCREDGFGWYRAQKAYMDYSLLDGSHGTKLKRIRRKIKGIKMGSNATPENIELLNAGSNANSTSNHDFLGVICLALIIGIVKWVVDIKTGTLPADIKEIKNVLNESAIKMAQMESKLWSHEDIARDIASAIDQHSLSCPFRKK